VFSPNDEFHDEMPNPGKSRPDGLQPNAVEDYLVNTDGQSWRSSLPYGNLVKSALSTFPSLFGRLAYLAAFRDLESDRYTDPTCVFEPHDVDAVLRHEHREAFRAWLRLSLEQQTEDLTDYLWTHLEDRRKMLWQRRHECPYARLIPSYALAAERDLFRSDLELLVAILEAKAL
jgi:hypothetical protein